MTASIIDAIAPPPAKAAATPVSPALVMPGALGRGPVVRFEDTLRAHTDGAGAGELPGLPEAGVGEMQIDDGDILRELSGAGMNAAATRGHLGNAREVSAESPDELVDVTDVAAPNVSIAFGTAVPQAAPLAPTLPGSTTGTPTVPVTVEGGVREAMAPARSPAESSRAPADAGIPLELSPEDIGDLAAPPIATARQGLGSNRHAGASPVAIAAASAESAVAGLASQSQAALVAVSSASGDPARPVSISPEAPSAPQSSIANRQALVQALGERLHVQLSRGSSQAVIRLDPPMMGTIEIVIRQDAGGVQVHLSASHSEVLRQLHAIGGALSQDLVQRNHGEVSVHVSDSTRDAEGRQRQRQGGAEDDESRPGRALHAAGDTDREAAFTL
jgi:type III secretion system needle length determinant